MIFFLIDLLGTFFLVTYIDGQTGGAQDWLMDVYVQNIKIPKTLTFTENAEKIDSSLSVRCDKQEVIHLSHEKFLFLSRVWDVLWFHGTVIKWTEQGGENATLADSLGL